MANSTCRRISSNTGTRTWPIISNQIYSPKSALLSSSILFKVERALLLIVGFLSVIRLVKMRSIGNQSSCLTLNSISADEAALFKS